MKVVDVCAFYAPKGGGVKTYVERKLAAFPAAGHELVVLAPGLEDRIEQRGPRARIRWLKSARFPLDRNYGYFSDREALLGSLDEERPDVVEASSPWRSASIVAEWPGAALKVLVAHADPLSAYAYRWFGALVSKERIDRAFEWYWRHLRRLDRQSDLVITASESLTMRLRNGGLRKVATVPMGVESGVFSPLKSDDGLRARLLDRCSLPADATLLVGIGRHSPEKRWPMVIEAVKAAGWRAPVGLVLVGDGHGSAGLKEAVGDNPHIRLLQPIADRQKLARLLASADALIHGCESETFCFVAAEARASGTALIVPDGGGAADHGRAAGGWLFRSGSAEDAAAKIAAFARSARLRQDPPAGRIRTMDDHFRDLLTLYTAAHTSDCLAA